MGQQTGHNVQKGKPQVSTRAINQGNSPKTYTRGCQDGFGFGNQQGDGKESSQGQALPCWHQQTRVN
eukprot:2953713-Ditylum_brightwellii.AAC.1